MLNEMAKRDSTSFELNLSMRLAILLNDIMHLLTEWESRTGTYLPRGHGVRSERSEDRVP